MAVLLHGLFGDGDNLKGLASRLADQNPSRRPALRPSLPAHGGMAATSPLSFDAMADELAARIAAELPAASPLHLIGHSLGGKIAMTLAGRDDAFAHRLRSLCVLDIGPGRYPPHHLPLIAALAALDTARLSSRGEADATLAPDIREPGVRAFLLKSLARDGDAWRWRFDLEAISRDYTEHLAAAIATTAPVTLPTLFIAGERSDYLDEPNQRAALQAFPQARIRTIAGTGHWLHAERADEVAAAVQAFLDEADARPAAPRAAR